MQVKDLIEVLENFSIEDQNRFIYANYEPNFEENFTLYRSDAGNIEIVPNSLVEELRDCQEFILEEI